MNEIETKVNMNSGGIPIKIHSNHNFIKDNIQTLFIIVHVFSLLMTIRLMAWFTMLVCLSINICQEKILTWISKDSSFFHNFKGHERVQFINILGDPTLGLLPNFVQGRVRRVTIIGNPSLGLLVATILYISLSLSHPNRSHLQKITWSEICVNHCMFNIISLHIYHKEVLDKI